tara:strand:- start:4484 stop:6169 length:1686 start_codon:yes stop_codon:yes gene_type:complete
MAENDLMFSSVYDTATQDNLNIRDNATRAAQAGRGMVGAQANALAGGMFAKGLARMAGMKTPAQMKAEKITDIMKQSGNLDRNDPNSYKKIAQLFIQNGLPGEAQKFLDKAREIETSNRTFGLETRKTDLLERQVISEESKTKSDIGVQESRLELDFGKFENLKYQQDRDYNLASSEQERLLAKDEYAKTQDAILNEIRNGDLDIARARQMLAENEFEFTKMFEQQKVDIQKDQWQQSYNLEELNSKAERELKLAQKDNIIIETENYTYNNNIKNSLIKAQTSAAELKTKLDARQLELPASGEYMMQTTEDGEQLLRFNPEINNYEVVTGKDGIALGLEEIEAQEYGLTADEARVYDNIWDQYKQRYYVAGAFPGEGNWKEDTPEFLDWAQANITGEEGLDIIVKGQGGTRKGYVNKLTAEFNNDEQLSDDQVAVVVEVPLDDNPMETRSEVQVFEVDTSSLAKELKVSEETINEVPKKVNGKDNTLTNGQLLIQAVQTGDSELAATVESNMGKDINPLDDTKKDEVNFRYQRFRGKVTKDMEATGNYVKRGNQWFVKKEK